MTVALPILRAPSPSARKAPSDAFRVALVAMPFGVEVNAPSIQLGLLRAIAEKTGFATDSFHLSLDLAKRITPALYNALCLHRGRMTGEWLFGVAAFGESVPGSVGDYLAEFPEELEWVASLGKDAAWISHLRGELLPRFVDDCLLAVDWGTYGVVGFSSTFQQQVASLALARRIKERHPHVRIVFGGANLDGEMGKEHARSFSFIDYVVVGEGDTVFPELLCRLAAGDPIDLRGVVARKDGGITYSGEAAPVEALDDLPTPNYEEYFARARALGLIRPGQRLASIPFESSRGCWWGAKHHCTFCGLNAQGMRFRAKSPKRVFDELDELAARHGISTFQATDNIVDMKFVNDVFRAIEEARTDYRFFYETKANLTREQLRTLYLGGVRDLQPGIESLSTHVLELMRKGCTMLQNVRLLKWCRYYGITVHWNLIWGFPGEKAEDYQRELDVLRHVTHFQPPMSASRIWLERFAPLFTEGDAFPVQNRRPEASYAHVYPAHVDTEKTAYFFDYTMEDTVPIDSHRATKDWVDEWRRRWSSERPDALVYRRLRDVLLIDEQRGGVAKHHELRGEWAAAYDVCSETMRTIPQVVEHLTSLRAASPDSPAFARPRLREWELEAGLNAFCQKGLMVSEGGRYLSLALPANPNW